MRCVPNLKRHSSYNLRKFFSSSLPVKTPITSKCLQRQISLLRPFCGDAIGHAGRNNLFRTLTTLNPPTPITVNNMQLPSQWRYAKLSIPWSCRRFALSWTSCDSWHPVAAVGARDSRRRRRRSIRGPPRSTTDAFSSQSAAAPRLRRAPPKYRLIKQRKRKKIFNSTINSRVKKSLQISKLQNATRTAQVQSMLNNSIG